MMNNKELIQEAKKAREKAYAPYSKFLVGACLMTKRGKLYHGCNIENITFTPTICAERTAFFKAVSEGERDFEKIAIVGGLKDAQKLFAPPCGVCRQVMLEFCDPKEFKIILEEESGDIREFLLSEIMPFSFSPLNQKLGQ